MTIQLCDCITRRHATTIWTHLQSPTKWVVELQTHIDKKKFKKNHTLFKITCKCTNIFLKKKMGLCTCVDYHGLIKIIVKIYYPLLLISKPLEQLNQIKLFTKKLERCLQSCTYKRRWWVENNISHIVWPFWIQCHVFWFDKCPCNFSTHNEWHIKKTLKQLCGHLLGWHLGIFQ
jgi:hypothetical protein